MMRLSSALLAILLLGAPAAMATEDPSAQSPAKTSEQCKADFDKCEADCIVKHGDDETKRAACIPVCTGRYAACDAKAAYEKARPWLEEKARKTKKFLEDLMKDKPAETPPAPAPAPADPDKPKAI